jgi:hypothetical protein
VTVTWDERNAGVLSTILSGGAVSAPLTAGIAPAHAWMAGRPFSQEGRTEHPGSAPATGRAPGNTGIVPAARAPVGALPRIQSTLTGTSGVDEAEKTFLACLPQKRTT